MDLAQGGCAQHLISMEDEGADKPGKSTATGGSQASGAKQLFGHKSGAKPWETSTAAGQADGAPDDAPTPSSAPYPRDASYTPRLASANYGAGDDELTKLHPNYKLLMRIAALFIGVLILFGSTVVDGVLSDRVGTPFGIVVAPAFILAIIVGFRVPVRRYNARGYQMSEDRLRVVRGIWWHSDTVVPFGRVQHIDVDQGPIERGLGIATLTLHTAGNHNSSVRLPGLGHQIAVEMREEIRAHIKRESQ